MRSCSYACHVEDPRNDQKPVPVRQATRKMREEQAGHVRFVQEVSRNGRG